MKTITTVVYTFDELNDKAKEKARDWYRLGGFENQDSWDTTSEDAAQIGLKIVSLDDHRANEGEFMGSAIETMEKIKADHGEVCETYQTALRYETALREDPEDDNIAHEFLHDLLEDYRVMLNKEIEYRYSDEAVDEMILANEYTFTAEGKREG